MYISNSDIDVNFVSLTVDKIAEPVELRFSFRSFPAEVLANARLLRRDDEDVGRPCSFSKRKKNKKCKTKTFHQAN